MATSVQAGKPLWCSLRAGPPLDVVGLGENSSDLLCVLDAWPSPGAKQPLARYEQRAGGQVASTVLGCARLGLRAGYIGVVGGDAAAEIVLEPLRQAGVDLSGVRRRSEATTRTAVVLVTRKDGERTVLPHRDPRLSLDASELEASEIERARALHVDATDPEAAEWAARTARAAGIPVVLDADRVWPGAERLLSVTDFPVVSREFAEEFGGTGCLTDGLIRLAGWGARLAVVTCGEEGAKARLGDLELASPAFAVDVVDTTGAGDAFRAGFIWGLLEGLSASEVLRAANAVAGLACTAFGAQQGLPERSELEAMLARVERSTARRW